MKASLVVVALTMLLASTLPYAVGQPGTVFVYTIHVDFFAPSCSLSIAQVSLYDSSGGLVGVGSSPYGGEIEISVRTNIPFTTLTATASGLATWSSYYTWPVAGTRSITLGNAGDYWITIAMS